jgi:hypothetical protein
MTRPHVMCLSQPDDEIEGRAAVRCLSLQRAGDGGRRMSLHPNWNGTRELA